MIWSPTPVSKISNFSWHALKWLNVGACSEDSETGVRKGLGWRAGIFRPGVVELLDMLRVVSANGRSWSKVSIRLPRNDVRISPFPPN